MNHILNHRAKKLRKNNSQAEAALWNMLRNRKLFRFKFRRQYVIEPYIVDFVCLKKMLVIELDGEHHDNQKNYDHKRTSYLELHGYRVIRFSNSEFFNKYEKVLAEICRQLMV